MRAWGSEGLSDPTQQLGAATEGSLLVKACLAAMGWLPAMTALAAGGELATPLCSGLSLLAPSPAGFSVHRGIMITMLPLDKSDFICFRNFKMSLQGLKILTAL